MNGPRKASVPAGRRVPTMDRGRRWRPSNASTAACSAEKSGLSFECPPDQVIVTCEQNQAPECSPSSANSPYRAPTECPLEDSPPTEPCDIKSFKLTLSNATDSKDFTLTSQRRREGVHPSVPRGYRYKLQHKDLIIEVLAPVEEAETSYKNLFNDKKVIKNKTAATGHEPIKVKATSTAKASCGKKHPAITARGGEINATSATAPLEFDIFSPAPSTFQASRWARLWPFGDNGSQEIRVEADSCGVNLSKAPTKNLSVLLMVMPDETWKLTFGLGTYKSGQDSIARARKVGPNKDKTGVVTKRERQVKNVTDNSSRTRIARTHFVEEHSTTEMSGGLKRTEQIVTEKDSTFGDHTLEYTKKSKASRIKIEHTVGGQTAEVEPSKIINGVIDALDTIKKLGDLFDSVPKVGWSISTSFSFLNGEATFEWGHRWPSEYSEKNRVYYVERFISLGGKVELAAGSVEVFFGVEIDPWWLDFYFVAKIYLEIKASASISPKGSVPVTNWHDFDWGNSKLDLGVDASIVPELGVKAGGRIFGYGLTAVLKVQSDITFKAVGKFSKVGPEATASIKSEGAHLVGKIEVVGKRQSPYSFDPIEIMEPKVIMQDKVIF